MGRTVREFTFDNNDFWDIIKAWALAKRFDLKEKNDDNTQKTYTKPVTIAKDLFYVSFQKKGKDIRLEAYFKDRLFGGEKSIDPNFAGFATKNKCRDLLKELMLLLDQPPI